MTETEAKWSERIRQWKESGKKAADFTAGQPYKATTLVWWATELRRRARAARARQSQPRRGTRIPMARVVTVPVSQPRGPAPERGRGAGLVVEVSGARISLERGFDAELLGQVVRALGGKR